MKNIKRYSLRLCAVLCAAGMLTACGSFSNMSEQDAYDIGYGLGTAARYIIDN